MTEYISIRNWDKWQSYRKDRGQPPWIKVHRCVMRNPEWVQLSDAERGQLVAMWLLAADHDGAIPASPELIQKLCFMETAPNLNKFAELGFLRQGDANVTPMWRQDVTPEKRRIEENRDRKETPPSPPSTPTAKILALYHETLPELPAISNGGPPKQLKEQLRARWREHPDLDWWAWYFKGIRNCGFLMGKKRDWRANLHWLTGPKNMAKVLSGQYVDKNSDDNFLEDLE